jgi:general secretion pathway protein L
LLYAYPTQSHLPKKLSTLLLRLPAHAITDTTRDLSRLGCAYTLYGKRDVIERVDHAVLADLAALIRNAQQVVLLLSAADVSVLRMVVPPLSAAKLRAALPNLIEDKLLGDVADCVVVCSAVNKSGSRSVAATQRAWLTAVVQTLRGYGAQRISALPEQLCLAHLEGCVSAAISESENGIALALRLSEHEGMGLILHSPDTLLQTLRSLIPASAITLYVPPAALSRYQVALAQDTEIRVCADNGSQWQLNHAAPDLASGLGASSQARWNWQPWRWPIALAALLLVIDTSALNFDWWRMNKEASNLRAAMKQIYLAAYPNESVILDPLLQMRQKITAAQRDTGQGAPDDFTSLAAEFGQVWASVSPATTISGIEYRERSLVVQLKSEVSPAPMQTALAARNLSLTHNRLQTHFG